MKAASLRIKAWALRLAGLMAFTVLLPGCTNVFFQPQKEKLDTPARYGIEYRAEQFLAADGTSLSAWFFPAQGKAKATVLFLHGNAENISTHFLSIAWLPAAGYNVLALDYRGYGSSGGSPSLGGAQLDIDAAMQHLLAHEGVDPDRIILFGQSLGGALAIHYAAHTRFRANLRAVVIDSAFYDYRQIAREKMAASLLTWPFQWLPWLVLDNDYSPAHSVAAISPIPLLLIQGDRDVVVPAHHARALFEHADEPKEFWMVSGAGHIQALDSAEVRKRLLGYLDRYAK